MTSVRETLNAAADLLEKPGAWTQGTFFVDDDGQHVEIRAGIAGAGSCMCMRGAIYRLVGDINMPPAVRSALHAVVPPMPKDQKALCPITAFNDAPHRTQAEVVQALRDAALAAGEGQ